MLTGSTADGSVLTANPTLLGRPARDHDHRAGRRPRRRQPGRGVRGRRPRLRPDRQLRRVVDRLRRDARPAAPRRSRSLSVQYYGFDTTQPAVRRRAGPPGVRRGRRLAADRRARGPDGTGAGRELDGPARDPGPQRRGLPARPTTPTPPGRCWPRPAIPGGAGFPDDDPDDRRRRVRRGDRRRARARARDHARWPRRWATATSTASRPIRPRCGRSAGSPTTRAATTSWACCSAPAPRTTTGAGARPTFDAAIAEAVLRRPIRTAASAAYDRAEDDRPATTSRSCPIGLRHRAGRCRATGCSGPARTGSASSGWPGWRGRNERRAALLATARGRGALLARVAGCPATGRRDAGWADVRDANGDVDLRDGHRRSTSRSPSTEAAAPGRAAPDVGRRDRPDGDRGRRTRRGRARRRSTTRSIRARRPPPPEHARSSRAGGSSRPTTRPTSRSGRRLRSSTPTTGSTGRRPPAISSGCTGTRATRPSAPRPSRSARTAVARDLGAARGHRD